MKQSEIVVGGVYRGNGPDREVWDIMSSQILRQPLVFFGIDGHKHQNTLKYFAAWAKERVDG